MALSGTLDSFPLPEVLRLLGRSGQTGMLVVRADDQEMRGYLQGGQLLFACSGDERDVKSRLVGGGLLEREGWEQVAAGEASADEVLAEEVSPLDYDRAVRSLTVDAFVEVMRRRQGSFEFEEGVTTSIRLGTELSIDDTLDEVDERLRAWNAIREVVPSMKARIQLQEDLPDGVETVDVSAEEWALIAQIGAGTSVTRLAKGTGESEFEVASRVAAFVNRGLAHVGETTPPHPGALERYPGVEVSDDPLGGEGPTGWTNELDSIAATGEPEPEPEPPLMEDDDLFPSADDSDVAASNGAVDFGLKGFAPKPGISGSDLALKAFDDEEGSGTDDPDTSEDTAGEDAEALVVENATEEAPVDELADDAGAVDEDEVEIAETAEADALELVGDEEALEELDAAAEGDVDDEGEDADGAADIDGDDDPDDEDAEEKTGALPNLLRRRNKGLLAKELSSLTD